MDLGTGLALFGSAKLAERLLGPTADYLGQGLKGLTERRVENVKRILSYTQRRLGPSVTETGAIPPRALQALLVDGSFVEDEVTAAYYGGVLASARTPEGRDDTAAAYLSLLSRLSVYQIRTHFIVYALFQRLVAADAEPSTWSRHRIQFGEASYQAAMGFTVDELSRFQSTLEQALFGLARESLLDQFSYGPDMNGQLWVEPTIDGALLFMYANGFGTRPVSQILSPECRAALEPSHGIVLPDDATLQE